MQNTPIALPVGELRPALAGLGKVIPRTARLPVLGAVKIIRSPEGRVTLTGTDLDSYITATLDQPSPGEPQSVILPLADLVRIVKTLPNSVSLHLGTTPEADACISYPVGSQQITVRVSTFPDDEFPTVPFIEADGIPLEDGFRESLLNALQCSSNDQTRYVLQGAYVDVSDRHGHHVVGTDGRHLYAANSFQLPIAKSVIIPARKFLAWRPFQTDGSWSLSVKPASPASESEQAWIRIASQRWSIITTLIDGTFPNYRQVIPDPSAFKTEIEFGEEGAAAQRDVIVKLPGDGLPNQPMTIHVEDRKCSVYGSVPEAHPPESISVTAQKISGPDITITVNRDYVAKALRFGLTRVQFIDEMSAIRFSRDGRQLVAMPLRTSTPAPCTPQAPAEPTNNPAPSEPQPESTMTETNGHTNGASPHINGAPRSTTPVPPATEKPAIEAAIEKLDGFKATFREALVGLTELTTLLKQSVREQKAGEKEIHQVRQTLRSLQSVKI